MSETKRIKEVEQSAVEMARQPTFRKMVSLFLKSLFLALVFVILITMLSGLGVPYLDTTWGKILVLAVLCVVAYPHVMREFRPRTYMERQ